MLSLIFFGFLLEGPDLQELRGGESLLVAIVGLVQIPNIAIIYTCLPYFKNTAP